MDREVLVMQRERAIAVKQADLHRVQNEVMAEREELAQHNASVSFCYTYHDFLFIGLLPTAYIQIMLYYVTLHVDQQANKCDAKQAQDVAGLTAEEQELKEELSKAEEHLRDADELMKMLLAVSGGVPPASTASGSSGGGRKRKEAA